jgi:hypothetical protein
MNAGVVSRARDIEPFHFGFESYEARIIPAGGLKPTQLLHDQVT